MVKSVWLVFVKDFYHEGDTEVHKVFADKEMAERCAEEITDNKHIKKFSHLWVDRAWVSDEYPVHERTEP
jgi:hypothetical protein